jgi:uncharacterized membrane protein
MISCGRNRWILLAIVGGGAYPFVVFASLGTVSPVVLVLLGLSLIGLRMVGLRRLARSTPWLIALGLGGAVMAAVFVVSPDFAPKAYPITISLTTAAVFGLSLKFPPNAIELIARLSEPDLPPSGVAYTRRVCEVWIGFLVINGGISLATAVWATVAEWALWNGLLSYVAMGVLFAGEYLVRQVVRRSPGAVQ